MDFSALMQLISSGGDVATIAVCWALWRFDRRLLKLEITIEKQQGENYVQSN